MFLEVWPHIVSFQMVSFGQCFGSVLATHSGLPNGQFWAMFLEVFWPHVVGFQMVSFGRCFERLATHRRLATHSRLSELCL